MDCIGIFGGAFNPPHNEHIRIATQLIEEFELSRLVFVPTKDAPHKQTETPFSKRCDMLRLATKGNPRLCIDEIEKDIEGTTYSHIVLKTLKEKYKNIVFVIGGDSMINLESWNSPQKIINTCPLLVVPRGERTDELMQAVEQHRKAGAKISVSRTTGKEVSSSLIRAHIEFGRSTSEYLDENVQAYIQDANLYKRHQLIIDKVKANLSAKRFEHTISTTLTAIKLNDTWGIDFDKVFLASLLHDCMKNSEKIHVGVPEDVLNTKVLHAFNGAIEAEVEYGIKDEDILNAIRYHTTGRPNMTRLEKLVYLADMIEPIRKYEGADRLREIAYKDAEQGFLETLRCAYLHLKKHNKYMYPLTEDCYNYYIKGANK